MRQSIYYSMGCAMLLLLGLSACASRSTQYTHGEIPRDTYGEPVWTEIGAPRHRPNQAPIYVPAGPPVRTINGTVVQPTGG